MAEVKTLDAKKEAAFSFGKDEKKLITDPLLDNNPVTVQILGVCSALAVTTLVTKAIVMGIAVTLVTTFSNYFTALLRDYIPKQIRMSCPIGYNCFFSYRGRTHAESCKLPYLERLVRFYWIDHHKLYCDGKIRSFCYGK